MSDRTSSDDVSRMWFVEDDPEGPDETATTISNDDALIAGGTISSAPATEDDLPSLVEVGEAESTIQDSQVSDETPEAAAEPDLLEDEDADHEVSTAEKAPDPTEDDDLTSTRVRRHSLLDPSRIAHADATDTEAADVTDDAADALDEATEISTGIPEVPADEATPAPPPSHRPAPTPQPHDLDERETAGIDHVTAIDPVPRPKLDNSVFEGATQLPSIPSRAPAHLWSLLLTLLLLPVTWFFAADGVTRLFPGDLASLPSAVTNWAGFAEIVAAALAGFVLVLLARYSSLGAFVWGVVGTVIGVTGLVAPGFVAGFAQSGIDALYRVNAFFGNVAHHAVATLPTGIVALAGLLLVGIGFVSHGARRKGRRDYQAKTTVDGFDQ